MKKGHRKWKLSFKLYLFIQIIMMEKSLLWKNHICYIENTMGVSKAPFLQTLSNGEEKVPPTTQSNFLKTLAALYKKIIEIVL